MISKALRMIAGPTAKSRCTIIFINQIRQKVGTFFGSPEVTCGGIAMKFYASIRLDIRRKEFLPNNEGLVARIKVSKNKVCSLPLLFLSHRLPDSSPISRNGSKHNIRLWDRSICLSSRCRREARSRGEERIVVFQGGPALFSRTKSSD